MKRFQFSLSGVLLAMLFVATGLIFSTQWAAGGPQRAFESALPIWFLIALVLSFIRSYPSPWWRIFGATMVTGSVWFICVFSTHLMFHNSLRMSGVTFPELLIRVLVVSGIGLAVAILGSFILAAISFAFRCWIRFSPRSRSFSVVLLTSVFLSGLVAWRTSHGDTWEPQQASPEEIADRQSNVPILFRHNTFPRDAVRSPDGRFTVRPATVNDRGVTLVVDYVNDKREVAAHFVAAENEWFQSVTFLPDSSGLAAIRAESGKFTLLRWNTADWRLAALLPLSEMYTASAGNELFPLLVDGHLVLLEVDDSVPERTRLEFTMVDLLDPNWTRREFASATVRLQRRIDKVRLNDANRPCMVSASGECLVIGLERDSIWVCRRGATEFVEFPGEALGFLANTEHLVTAETSWRLPWSRRQRPRELPPFWDHLRTETIYRLSAIDCGSARRIAESRWFACRRGPLSNPLVMLDWTRSRAIVSSRDGWLTWQLP